MAANDSTTLPVGPAVPYDPEIAVFLPALREAFPHCTNSESLTAARAFFQQRSAEAGLDSIIGTGRFTASEHVVAGPVGAPAITVLVIQPIAAQAPMPAIYNIHGGGMVLGDRFTFAADQLDLIEEFGLAMVSVEYRLAPETPHPGPVEDCYAGLVWLASAAAELGIDAARIIVAGASAGGGLAAACALLARDRGGPAIFAQLLMCPMIDDRDASASSIQEDGRGVFDRPANDFGWRSLLGAAKGGPDVPIYAAPARATDLSGLPPAFIDVGSAETFRDEAVAYASGIWRSGGSAELCVFAGGFHGYSQMVPDTAISAATRDARAHWLRRILRSV